MECISRSRNCYATFLHVNIVLAKRMCSNKRVAKVLRPAKEETIEKKLRCAACAREQHSVQMALIGRADNGHDLLRHNRTLCFSHIYLIQVTWMIELKISLQLINSRQYHTSRETRRSRTSDKQRNCRALLWSFGLCSRAKQAPKKKCQSREWVAKAHSLGLFFVAVERREFDQKNIHKNKN